MNKRLFHINNIDEDDFIDKKRTFYYGIDPTGPGIHIGHFVPLRLCLGLLQKGWKGIFLIGGFTGKVGDPTDKMKERQRVEDDFVQENLIIIKKDLDAIFQGLDYIIVNNKDWLDNLLLRDYLEIAYNISINKKLNMETFKRRIESESHLSAAEFLYSDLQFLDFLHLYKNFNCTVQIGGQDQWGNISFGVDVMKKIVKTDKIYGISSPLLLSSSGEKISKTSQNTPYLREPELVYNHILNMNDETAKELLDLLTEQKMEDPFKTKEELIKYFFDVYFHDSLLFDKIKEKMDKKFYGNVEDMDELISVKSNKISVILSEIDSSISTTFVRNQIKQNAVRVNGEVVLSDIVLTEGKYKISLNKKSHFFLSVK